MNDREKNRLLVLKRAHYLNRNLPKLLTQLVQIEPKLESTNILKIEEIDELISKLKLNNQELIFIKRTESLG